MKKVSVVCVRVFLYTQIYVSREFFGLDSIQTICVPVLCIHHTQPSEINIKYVCLTFVSTKPSTGKKDDRSDIGHAYQKPFEIIK